MSSDWGSTTQEPGKFSDEMCLEEKDWEWDTGHRDKWRKERGKKTKYAHLPSDLDGPS